MTYAERTTQAVYNNAVWCDTVCRAHGRPGEFRQGMWLNLHETPPFYPNAITLSASDGPAKQLEHLRELLEAGIPGAWAVKDSFSTLDLAPLGFRPVFDANWLYREELLPVPEADNVEVRPVRIGTAYDLSAWERAWSGGPGAFQEESRIFLPSLLADDNVAFIAVWEDSSIVAGAIANRTGAVVGISNVFLPPHDGDRFRACCVAGVMELFPGLPIVGYEAGEDAIAMQRLGFAEVGPLRVWAAE